MEFTIIKYKPINLHYRAVVFRLFQKTVILPPNPVSFRLTYMYMYMYTQL